MYTRKYQLVRLSKLQLKLKMQYCSCAVMLLHTQKFSFSMLQRFDICFACTPSGVYHHVTIQRLLSVTDTDNPRICSPRATHRASGMLLVKQGGPSRMFCGGGCSAAYKRDCSSVVDCCFRIVQRGFRGIIAQGSWTLLVLSSIRIWSALARPQALPWTLYGFKWKVSAETGLIGRLIPSSSPQGILCG